MCESRSPEGEGLCRLLDECIAALDKAGNPEHPVPAPPMTRVTLIDNYDSFTFNLVHYLGELGADVAVHRNDAVSVAAVVADDPDAIVLSPGPCTPKEAGICMALIAQAGGKIPIMGVCLGHQAIGAVYGGEVVRGPVPMHGKVSTILHDGQTVFRGINGPFEATRYHSLIVKRDTMPEALAITAETKDGIVMGLSHKSLPVHGVQFHPESILSEHGHLILKNFLELAEQWNASGKRARLPHAAHVPPPTHGSAAPA